jgi:hypothetical protein
MADKSLRPGEGLFNLPASLSTVCNQDLAFWRLHAQWREAEDAFEASPYAGDDPEGELMIDHATALRDAMFMESVSTATALAAKLDAISEGGPAGVVGMDLPNDRSVFDVIRRDCQRLADREAVQPVTESRTPSLFSRLSAAIAGAWPMARRWQQAANSSAPSV